MIRLAGVTHRFSGKIVLESIDLDLREGQTHVVIGSSGAGKTTLLRLVLGLLPVQEGSLSLNGVRATPENGSRLRDQMGYVVQEGGLFPHLTARDNVLLALRASSSGIRESGSRLRELVDMVGLDPALMDRFPVELSGGQRQRVGLMRALIKDPPILILDEPLGALDPLVRSELQTQLKQLFNELKKTVLIVTHDLNEAAYFGHTISLLHEGRLLQHGSFADLAGNPASGFVTQFLNAQRPPDEILKGIT